MTNPLDYVHTPIPESGVMKFSPSSFSKFIDQPHNWYRSEVLGESLFDYSTSSVIGTIVHYCAEMAAKREPADHAIINEYIDKHEPKEDYDPQEVRTNWHMMAATLCNEYVVPNHFLGNEIPMSHMIKDDYYAAGTLDAIQGDRDDAMVVDYKTYNSKTKPRSIPMYYKAQLLVYAYIMRGEGYNPTRFRLVYVNRNIDGGLSEKTGKPLKSYPPEVTVLTESITEDDWEFITNMLDLAVDTVKFHKERPELAHITWHDPRLKPE